jgi:DNA-binding MarR family transcriptional regulator
VLPFPGKPIFKSAFRSSIPASVAVILSNSAYHNLCYLGYYQLGINGKELPRYFGISRPSVSQAIKRGEKFAKENDVKLLS